MAVSIIKEVQPDHVVQLGDLYDLFGFSRYPRSLNICTPKQEMEQARAMAERFWHNVQQACPGARCHQLIGNHDERALKRTLEQLPAAEGLMRPALQELFTFPGVSTQPDFREELVIDDVVYQHGHLTFGQHAAHNRRSTVTGHLHKAAIRWWQDERGLYFEMNAGWVGDASSHIISYKAQRRLHGLTLGIAQVDVYGPRFIPFL